RGRKARRPQARGPPAGPRRHATVRRRRKSRRPRDFGRFRTVGGLPGRHGVCHRRAGHGRHKALRRRARHKSSRLHTPSALHASSLSQRMNSMTNLYFTEDHEWLRVEAGIATIGITDYAQEQLGDIVFVEVPEAGKKLAKGDTAVVVESVKAASDVYAPVDGEITEANEALTSDPALVNSAPADAGWLWKMRLADESQLDGLMDEAAYKAHI